MLLAIDTATRIAGIALYNENGLHAEHVWRTSDNHTMELMPCIVHACEQQTLRPAELEAVGVSLGPGSFTGLRVGLSIAKGLALALGIALMGVTTLDAAAHAHSRQCLPICAVLPAGRGMWCTAFYSVVEGSCQRRSDYALVNTATLIERLQEPTLICGELDTRLREALRADACGNAVVTSPAYAAQRAGFLAELAWRRFACGERDDMTSLSPIYLQRT